MVFVSFSTVSRLWGEGAAIVGVCIGIVGVIPEALLASLVKGEWSMCCWFLGYVILILAAIIGGPALIGEGAPRLAGRRSSAEAHPRKNTQWLDSAWWGLGLGALIAGIFTLLVFIGSPWRTRQDGRLLTDAEVGIAPSPTVAATNRLAQVEALAKKGDADAQYRLGLMYENGTDGAVTNWWQAEAWYRKAAEQGHLGAMKQLCFNDDGQVTDLALCKKAAEQGNLDCQYALGELFEGDQIYWGEKGLLQMQRDLDEAVNWYRKAGEHGHLQAQAKLGYIYWMAANQEWTQADDRFHGKAVPPGATKQKATAGTWGLRRRSEMVAPPETTKEYWAESAKWFRKAAEQGDADSQNWLGTCFRRGDGVREDVVEAAKWYRRAAEQGEQGGMSSLGEMYAKGEGVPQNYVEAYKWLNLAAAGKSLAAFYAEERRKLERRMTPEQIAEAQRRSEQFVPRKEGRESDPSR